MGFPKVLIAAPTARIKDYAFKDWLHNIMSFTYPNYDIRLFDNTEDYGANAIYQNSYFDHKYGAHNEKFKCYNSLCMHNIFPGIIKSVIERMCVSHNDCRDEMLKNNYDYLLHLETDVFPDKNIIEELMAHDKKVVSAVYYRDEGINRQACLQHRVIIKERQEMSVKFLPQDDLVFVDGGLKKVAHSGLGCALIKREVIEKIKFRFVPGADFHPDTFFMEDCTRNKIDIFVDTNQICEHRNQAWGRYGKDFN